MLVSSLFAVALLIVVAVYYLVPRKQVCPGCSAPRPDDVPLCSSCGWVFDEIDDDAEDDDQEPEELDELEQALDEERWP